MENVLANVKESALCEVQATAFLRSASSYAAAAGILFKERNQHRELTTDPIYFLYVHAIELVLKSALLANNYSIHKLSKIGHDLKSLYEQVIHSGLEFADKMEADNIILSLHEANNTFPKHPFRYYNTKTLILPELEWISNFVNHLLGIVEVYVSAREDKNVKSLLKLTMTISKPRSVRNETR